MARGLVNLRVNICDLLEVYLRAEECWVALGLRWGQAGKLLSPSREPAVVHERKSGRRTARARGPASRRRPQHPLRPSAGVMAVVAAYERQDQAASRRPLPSDLSRRRASRSSWRLRSSPTPSRAPISACVSRPPPPKP